MVFYIAGAILLLIGELNLIYNLVIDVMLLLLLFYVSHTEINLFI